MVQICYMVMCNFLVFGWGWYVLEEFCFKFYQYFIEFDINGCFINWIYCLVVYQWVKKVCDIMFFGIQFDFYWEGYEWFNYFIVVKDVYDFVQDLWVMVGNVVCCQFYFVSFLNVFVMSFGFLSKNVIMVFNGGVEMGGFVYNIGEGGISFYYEKYNGDLIYQFGIGYFGCCMLDGQFFFEVFVECVVFLQVKMIEVKLLQGVKFGYGGILLVVKNILEIVKIRGVKVGILVFFFFGYKVFFIFQGLVVFIGQFREFLKGKLVGFKFCMGSCLEFMVICKVMIEADIYLDFIVVDGGEGGIGVVLFEFFNLVGMFFWEGLVIVYDILYGFGIKQYIKFFVFGKIFMGFYMFWAFVLGVDVCYSVCVMMLVLGCIQALECNKNNCLIGVVI